VRLARIEVAAGKASDAFGRDEAGAVVGAIIVIVVGLSCCWALLE